MKVEIAVYDLEEIHQAIHHAYEYSSKLDEVEAKSRIGIPEWSPLTTMLREAHETIMKIKDRI